VVIWQPSSGTPSRPLRRVSDVDERLEQVIRRQLNYVRRRVPRAGMDVVHGIREQATVARARSPRRRPDAFSATSLNSSGMDEVWVCAVCGNRIRVHEPIMVREIEGWRETSLAREPHLPAAVIGCIHVAHFQPPRWRS
jgi:hypothetical protein